VLRFRDLGASFSRFRCFVLRSTVHRVLRFRNYPFTHLRYSKFFYISYKLTAILEGCVFHILLPRNCDLKKDLAPSNFRITTKKNQYHLEFSNESC